MRDLLPPGYVIDTSALVDLWRRRYPKDVFPTLWENLEKMISKGELVAPQEVLGELKRHDDELYRWAQKQKCFKTLDEEQIACTQDIVAKHPTLVDPNKTTPEADPFVISLAWTKGWKVITQETPAGRGPREQIPDVAAAYKVNCLSLLDFFRENPGITETPTKDS